MKNRFGIVLIKRSSFAAGRTIFVRFLYTYIMEHYQAWLAISRKKSIFSLMAFVPVHSWWATMPRETKNSCKIKWDGRVRGLWGMIFLRSASQPIIFRSQKSELFNHFNILHCTRVTALTNPLRALRTSSCIYTSLECNRGQHPNPWGRRENEKNSIFYWNR